MNRSPIYVLLLVLSLITVQTHGQKKADSQITVTSAEQREIQVFAKRFVKRLQETHDLTPLIREFFISDFARCLRKELYEDTEGRSSRKLQLSFNEILRGYIAGINLLYIQTVAYIYDSGRGVKGPYDPFKSTFPPRIQKQLDELGSPTGLMDEEKLKDRKTYLLLLTKTEKALAEAREYLTKKKIEEKPDFLKESNKYAASDWLGYTVETQTANDNSFCNRQGSKTYTVTTPTLLVLAITKENGKFKVYFVGMYDD